MIVLSLLTLSLLAPVGQVAYAELLVHSDENTTLVVQNTTQDIMQGTTKLRIPFTAQKGTHEVQVRVEQGAVAYELPITVSGKQTLSWLWSLATLPLIGIGALYFRRRRAGNS